MFSKLFGLPERLIVLDGEIMEKCEPFFGAIDRIKEYNQLKVLRAFTENRVGVQHLGTSTGYGYGDAGRDLLDRVFADIVGAKDALCRQQFMSGTHAITIALFGVLRAGDMFFSATGIPYDTLADVIGLSEKRYGSLREFGVNYSQVDFKANGEPDLDAIGAMSRNAKAVYIQRSRGYGNRSALSCTDIEKISVAAKTANPEIIVMVDNCYGEFTETREPTEHGADVIIGSLIKNPGGAVAETGGYIAGRADLVELCAHRLTVPGTGREIGCSPSGLRNLYLGLYMAPSVTAEALKSAVYSSALFEKLGYSVSPRYDEPRYDIITAINMKNEEALTSLCRAIQSASPIDSYAVPEAWDMPGYDSKVIMAAGAFTCGSSIELSCDAPVKPPYTAYLQGGISLAASRYAFLRAAQMFGKKS